MANFYSELAPKVIFSKDPTAVLDYMKDHKQLTTACNCLTCTKPMEMVTRPLSSTSDGFWLAMHQPKMP